MEQVEGGDESRLEISRMGRHLSSKHAMFKKKNHLNPVRKEYKRGNHDFKSEVNHEVKNEIPASFNSYF